VQKCTSLRPYQVAWEPHRAVYAARRKISVSFLICLGSLRTSGAYADPMIGDVAAAVASPETTSANPANVVFMDRAQIGGSGTLLKSESRSIRFPGSPSTIEKNNGFAIPISYLLRPSLVLRPTARLGISGFVVPPLLSIQTKIKKVPLVILKSRNAVDLDARAKVNFMGSGAIGYRFNEKIGAGIWGEYRSATFDADIAESFSGASIGTTTGKSEGLESVVGVRFEPKPGQVSLGLAVTLVTMSRQTVSVETPLAPQDGSNFGNSEINTMVPLSRILVGAQIAFGRLRLLGDIRISRFDKESKNFSIVDFKEKKRDIHDTVAVNAGVVLNVLKGVNFLSGFKYEPTPIGAGSRSSSESDGLAGFGTVDLAQEIIGASQLSPYYPALPFWQFATGLQFSLAPQVVPKEEATGKESSRFYRYTLGAGIGYRHAALGIDENGEQPGAYLIKTIFVPMLAIVRF
jgi:hypothetical protein